MRRRNRNKNQSRNGDGIRRVQECRDGTGIRRSMEEGFGVSGRALIGGGEYICGRLLGQGAFSRVYYVEHGKTRKGFACKLSENIPLLEKEAETLAGLKHPLFPEYYGLWREAGMGFLLMEYVPGSSMEEMLARRGGFSDGQIARAGMELAEGLLYFHERPGKPLFRDVKPSNIMVRQDGRLKLLDFGCMCYMGEEADSRAGSPGYAAPEQLSGDGLLTAACDVYGLGRTMERMLGDGGSRRGWMKIGLRRRRFRKSLMGVLEACTRRKQTERIPDMRGVMAALAPLVRAEGKGRIIPGYGNRDAQLDVVYWKNIYESEYRG